MGISKIKGVKLYPSDIFTGRESEIEEINDSLAQCGTVVLSGLGGIGKSELAKHFAHDYGRQEGHVVVWVTYNGSMLDTIAHGVKVDGLRESQFNDVRKLFEAKVNVLSNQDDVLLVIDNCNYTMEDFCILDECPCLKIVTTRNMDLPRNYHTIRMEHLPPEVAFELLEKTIEIERRGWVMKNKSNIMKLIQHVDYHTLVVILIGDVINNNDLTHIDFNRDLFAISDEPVRLSKDGTCSQMTIQDHVRNLYKLSKLHDSQRRILYSASLLPPGGCPRDQFCSSNNIDKRDVKALVLAGWLKTSFIDDVTVLCMHPVIRELVRSESFSVDKLDVGKPYDNMGAVNVSDILIEAAEGSTDAQYKIGNMYLGGNGLEHSSKKAFKMYSLAANSGHLESQIMLGTMFSTGNGCDKSVQDAVKWFDVALKQNEQKTIESLEQLVVDGNPIAQMIYGKLCIEGCVNGKSAHDAYPLFIQSMQSDKSIEQTFKTESENGDLTARAIMASLMIDSGGEDVIARGLQLLSNTALKGNVFALSRLEDLADSGNLQAQYTVGCTLFSLNNPESKHSCVYWLANAAAKGNDPSLMKLIELLLNGDESASAALDDIVSADNHSTIQRISNLAMNGNNSALFVLVKLARQGNFEAAVAIITMFEGITYDLVQHKNGCCCENANISDNADLNYPRSPNQSAHSYKNSHVGGISHPEAGFNVQELRSVGFSKEELIGAGFRPLDYIDPKMLRTCGLTADQLLQLEFPSHEILCAGFSTKELVKAGFSVNDLKAAGFSAIKLRDAGFSVNDLKLADFSVIELKDAGFSAADLRDAGFSAKTLKNNWYNSRDLRNAGFSAKELKDAWFTGEEIKNAGFSEDELLFSRYSAAQLIRLGKTPKQLIDAGFSLKELIDVGCDAKALRQAGCGARELLSAGFTPKQLSDAGISKYVLRMAGCTDEDFDDIKFGFDRSYHSFIGLHSTYDSSSNLEKVEVCVHETFGPLKQFIDDVIQKCDYDGAWKADNLIKSVPSRHEVIDCLDLLHRCLEPAHLNKFFKEQYADGRLSNASIFKLAYHHYNAPGYYKGRADQLIHMVEELCYVRNTAVHDGYSWDFHDRHSRVSDSAAQVANYAGTLMLMISRFIGIERPTTSGKSTLYYLLCKSFPELARGTSDRKSKSVGFRSLATATHIQRDVIKNNSGLRDQPYRNKISENEIVVDGIDYSIAGSTLKIVGQGTIHDVPSEFRDTTTIIRIEEGIINIGVAAFSGWQIESVHLPRSMRCIRRHAFEHCSMLKSVINGGGVMFIGSYAFNGTAVTNVYFPNAEWENNG